MKFAKPIFTYPALFLKSIIRTFVLSLTMNFLAHIYLSGSDERIQIGNFMADGVRGSAYHDFPEPFRCGILLHRAIDTFTDSHPNFRKSTKKLHQDYHHYSGVIVDLFYDHFLAANWTQYTLQPLDIYAQDFYKALQRHQTWLTERAKQLYPVMVQHNWLTSYATVEGLHQILTQMDSRTQYKSRMQFATANLITQYADFKADFEAFFPELEAFSKEQLVLLKNKLSINKH